jgi:hypothetical protein
MTTRMELEAMCREVLLLIMEPFRSMLVKKKIGIAIFLFDFGERGNLAYASTANRDDMVDVMREWLAMVSPANSET